MALSRSGSGRGVDPVLRVDARGSGSAPVIVFEDGSKEDVVGDAPTLPAPGQTVTSKDGKERKVSGVLTWQQRRERMQNVCVQCHQDTFVRGAYQQFDAVVERIRRFYKERYTQ